VHPVGLFRSVFHENAIEQQFEKFVVSKTCPGVSQAYNREMAEKIVHLLDTNPMIETVYGWDYHWPAILERSFLISSQSMVEHLGRDINEAGIHCAQTGSSGKDLLTDYLRDCALNKTEVLATLAEFSIKQLQNLIKN